MPGFPNRFPRRGEIYWAPADKVRPVLIVSADIGNQHSNSVIAAAITRTIPDRRYPTNVHLEAGDPLPKAGEILCRSLYVFLKSDLADYRATISTDQLDAVNRALAVSLGLPKQPD